MLKADKNRWFENVFAVYNRFLVFRRFNSFRVSGLNLLTDKHPTEPMIIYANHSSWWDGLIAFQISRKTKLDGFIMMEEKQLRSLRLFLKLGAFSVVREDARQALKSIEYAEDLLKQNAERTLWIFPQGEIKPNDLRPLRFYNGASRIILNFSDISVMCAAIRYEFLGAYKPEIFVKIKKLGISDYNAIVKPRFLSDILEKELTGTLDELKFDIVNGNFPDYENIL